MQTIRGLCKRTRNQFLLNVYMMKLKFRQAKYLLQCHTLLNGKHGSVT